jgi:hypothetical protein
MSGGVGIAVALPALEAMLDASGTALAAGAPLAKRFGVFFWGNGVRLNRWIPQATGPGWALTDELAPLRDVKDYVSVVSGTEVKTGSAVAHISSQVGLLSGAPPVRLEGLAQTYAQPSIDQVVARAIGGETRFRSLELGVSRRLSTYLGNAATALSFNGPNSYNRAVSDPQAVYDRLFGGGGAGDATAASATLALRRSALDVVGADLRALRARLGQPDRVRLDQHAEGIRAIERRLEPGAVRSCTGGGRPASTYAPLPSGDEQWEPLHGVMSDLLVLALACDVSRVFTYLFSGANNDATRFPVASRALHPLTHEYTDPVQPEVHVCVVFAMQRLAELLAKLKATREGDGNLLDQVVLFACSEVAEGRSHSTRDVPILVAGRGGGALRHPGIHYRSTTRESVTRLHLTMLQALGLPLKEFGAGPGLTAETLSALRA